MDMIMGILVNLTEWIETYIINGFMAWGFPFLLGLLLPFLK